MWKKLVCLALCLTLCLTLCALPAGAAGLSEGAMEEKAPMTLPCVSAMLLEPESGQIIFEVNADEKRPVASVVKIMTILLTVEAEEAGRLSLTDPVSISENAAGMGGSQVLLDPGETQTVDALLKSAIVGSANDAVVALAEHIAGSVPLFVDRMNERASQLGMKDTWFVNATGLPAEGQHTTARDVARMAAELVKHPTYFRYSTVWLDEVVHNSGRTTTLTNTNRLIRLYDGCDGIKTGSTKEAGYCMAATAVRGGMRLIAVVLGAPSGSERFDAARQMLDYGFAGYRRYPVAEKGARIRGELPVRGGRADSVALELGEDLTLLLKKGEESLVSLEPSLPEAIDAPVDRGERVGSVDVLLGERLVARLPVVEADEVPGQRFWDGWRRVKQNWFYER